MRTRFSLGQTVITCAAFERLPTEEVLAALQRHQSGDWGELDDNDRQENERSLTEGGRLLSRYRTKDQIIFWIITEADRSVTTVLLPEDY